MNLKLLWTFITAIPDLLKLLAAIDKGIKESQSDRKVKDDVKTVHQAFIDRDGAKITALFSGDAPSGPDAK